MQRLCATLEWIEQASIVDLQNKKLLADWIGQAGLYHETRKSPHDHTKTLYGDDSRYMLPASEHHKGMWQTPLQLAGFLITISSKDIRRYLDIGTWTGWTITVVSAYLKRFGLQHVDTVDVTNHCTRDTQAIWSKFSLPINYIVCNAAEIRRTIDSTYDFVFIDGNHDYEYVRTDFVMYSTLASRVAFHDINDAFCPGVVKLWTELKASYAGRYSFKEFVDHPNHFNLMGIGLIIK
jgi:hypothetical protein